MKVVWRGIWQGTRAFNRNGVVLGIRSISSDSIPLATKTRIPRTIFSGIQPTGIPHLGNYLGALRNWVDLQEEARSTDDELFFSIVGLHAITLPQDPSTLLTERRDMLATLLAIGLDPNRCTVFHQDQVCEHAELAWYLNCITPIGKLNRMTTWKSKLAIARNAQHEKEVDESQLSLGLFAYPVLQAADILLYKATHVPVGEDQVQHLELSRDIADIFNRTFKSKLFPLPQHLLTPTKRILSLRDPTQKMSKSHPDAASRILLTDSDADIQKKIKKAVTDGESNISYDAQERPGVSNLLSILAALESAKGDKITPEDMIAKVTREYGNSGSALKSAITETIIGSISPIRKELQRIKSDIGYLEQVEKQGREKAQIRAAKTMEKVRRLTGMSA